MFKTLVYSQSTILHVCFIVPRWHSSRVVCVCVCVWQHAFCFYVDGGWGGFGHKGNKPVPVRETAPFMPPLFASTQPPAANLSLHVFDSSFVRACTSAVGGCILKKQKSAAAHSALEKKLFNKRLCLTD